MAVIFGFDLEDQIFENQVSMKADQLSESMQLEAGARQTVTGLEMEYFQGRSEERRVGKEGRSRGSPCH